MASRADSRTGRSRRSQLDAGQIQRLLARALSGDVVSRIGVAHDARGWIVPQHALDALGCSVRAVADDDDACVLRIAHTDAAAVMQRYPGGAGGRVQQGVEE